MTTYTALCDACVLYPAPLRDALLWLSTAGLFRARWTDRIHDEWVRNLVARGGDRQRLERTRRLMNDAVPDCLVTGYEPLIDTLDLPDPDDRHVLAAAIVGGADVIVTANLRHFPPDKTTPFGVEVQHPDDFIVCQIDLAPAAACVAFKRQRANLKRPPRSAEEFLDALARCQLPQTVERLREFAELI